MLCTEPNLPRIKWHPSPKISISFSSILNKCTAGSHCLLYTISINVRHNVKFKRVHMLLHFLFDFHFPDGKPLKTFCSFNSTGFIGVRDSAFFIAYHKNDTLTSGGFKMAYTFVIDNFPPPTIPPTIPSPVGGDNGKTNYFIIKCP